MRQVSTNLSTLEMQMWRNSVHIHELWGSEWVVGWPLFVKKVMKNCEIENRRQNGWRADRCWQKWVSWNWLPWNAQWTHSKASPYQPESQWPRMWGYNHYSKAQKAPWQERWNYCLLPGESSFLFPPPQGIRLAVWPHTPGPHAP